MPLQPKQSRLEDFVSNAFPILVCTPHLISPRGGLKSASLWRADVAGSGSHPPPLGGPWGLSIVEIPSHQEIGPTPVSHPIRRVVVVTEASGRIRQGGEMHPRPSSPFSGPVVDSGRALDSRRTMGPIGFRERPFGWLQIQVCVAPARAWTVARAMILPRYRGQERSGCSLCSGRKQRTVRNKQCQMPISPSEYFRLEFNQPSPRGLPLLDDQGMPFHPASLNVNGRDRGTVSRLLPISCCVRRAVEFWSACCDGR